MGSPGDPTHAGAGTVGEVMTSPAMSMPTGADAADLAKVMLETKVRVGTVGLERVGARNGHSARHE